MSLGVHFPEEDVRYDALLGASVTANFFLPPHSFVISLSSDDPIALVRHTRPLNPLVIYNGIDNVLSGQILDQIVNEDDTVTIRGCDHTWRFDGDLDPANKAAGDSNLLDLIQKQLAAFGIDTVGSDNSEFRTGTCSKAPEVEPADSSENKVVPSTKIQATKAWTWLNQITAMYGYFVQPGLRGNSIQIVKPEFNQPPTYELRRLFPKSDPNNNVGSRNVSRGYKGVPTFVQGQNRTGTKKSKLAAARVESSAAKTIAEAVQAHAELQEILGRRGLFERHNFRGEAPAAGLIDQGVQKVYSPMFFTDRHTHNAGELQNRINREFFDFFKNTLVATYTMPGFNDSDHGGSYTIDTVAAVTDPVAGIEEDLYVAERTFTLSGGKETTRLTLIRKQSYTI